MPRIVTCHMCRIITKFPDVPKGTPMVPARMIFKDGSDFTYKDDDGHPVMVPQFDPMLEDFVENHEHGLEDSTISASGVIEVMQVEQKTWETMDVMADGQGPDPLSRRASGTRTVTPTVREPSSVTTNTATLTSPAAVPTTSMTPS